MEDFKKTISNIWYHYKAYILIGLAVIFLIIYSSINARTVNKYDYSVAIISKNNYPSEKQVEKLTTAFEKKYNATFEIKIYNVELGGYGEDDVIISKLSLDLANHISTYLFIEHLDAFDEATNNLEINVLGQGKEFDWLKDCGVDELWLATRVSKK